MDPKFCSPALSRYSLDTVITSDGGSDDLQRENIYQQPDDVVKSESFKRHSQIPAAFFQQISLDYEDPDDLQPEYHELEPERTPRSSNTTPQPSTQIGINNQGLQLDDEPVRQWKPRVPRKPTVLRDNQFITSSSFEEEDYYSEALGSQIDLSPDKFEELYAKVDKTKKTRK